MLLLGEHRYECASGGEGAGSSVYREVCLKLRKCDQPLGLEWERYAILKVNAPIYTRFSTNGLPSLVSNQKQIINVNWGFPRSAVSLRNICSYMTMLSSGL